MAEEVAKKVETGRVQGFYRPEPMKMIRVPDLSAKGGVAKRGDPFILTDFRGSDAYQNI